MVCRVGRVVRYRKGSPFARDSMDGTLVIEATMLESRELGSLLPVSADEQRERGDRDDGHGQRRPWERRRGRHGPRTREQEQGKRG